MEIKNIFNKNISFKAFTLAEVLIVLGIIGIIAEITIPTLIDNYQKEVTITKLKKAYSEITNAIVSSQRDNGMVETWNFPNTDLASTTDFVTNYFYPYIKTIKKCDHTDNSCWTTPVSLDNTTTTFSLADISPSLSAITVSGYSLLIYVAGSTTSVRFFFIIDIDGPNKGQNKSGKDVFGYVYRATATPSGKQGPTAIGMGTSAAPDRTSIKTNTTNGCNKDATGSGAGYYCAGLILLDGWEIADDYPW